jgi:small-conductance mechanosensitive channel
LTTSAPGANYTDSQLVFVATGSLVLWLVFVFIQTVRHRDYFLPAQDAADEAVHAAPPSHNQAWLSFALLLVALVMPLLWQLRLALLTSLGFTQKKRFKRLEMKYQTLSLILIVNHFFLRWTLRSLDLAER